MTLPNQEAAPRIVRNLARYLPGERGRFAAGGEPVTETPA